MDIIPIWLILLIVAAVLYYKYLTVNYGTWKKLSIPGPPPAVALGNTIKMFDPVKGVRQVLDEWKQKYGKVFGLYFFEKPLLVVMDIELLKIVYVKDFGNFQDRWMQGDGLLQQSVIKKGLFFEDGVDWKRIRRIMSPTFSSGKLRLLMHHINKTGNNLGDKMVDCAVKGELPEAHVTFGAYALDVICGTAFGLDINSQSNHDEPFIKHAKSLMTFGKRVELMFLACSFFPFLKYILKSLGMGFFNKADVEYFKTNLTALIAERKQSPNATEHTDFLQLLLNAESESSTEDLGGSKKLTSDEVVAQGIIFIIAGYGTTSSLLQFMFYELGRHQDIQEKIEKEIKEFVGEKKDPTYEDCQNLKYLEAVINETLRVYPPVHLLTRRVYKEVKLGHYTIPSNGGVFIPIANIMQDPEYFPDPDCFMPERFLTDTKQASHMNTFLPFGLGPRQCVGMRFALLEIKVAVVHMLKRVQIVEAFPKVLDIEDNLGVLEPRKPIKLKMRAKANKKEL